MLLLIDGYNLLHQSDLLGRSRAGRWLQRARERLLRQLASQLGTELRANTCIVFDAEDPPPGRPHQLSFQTIDVRFAVDYPEADDLLEELIAHHAAPTRLTVVSSDHRVQRAILRRRGHCFDADQWYQRLISDGPVLGIPWPPVQSSDDSATAAPEKPQDLDAAETAEWLAAFGIAPAEAPPPQEQTSEPEPPAKAAKPARRPAASKAKPKSKPKPKRAAKPPSKGQPKRKLDAPADNPFPEGYGEDLL